MVPEQPARITGSSGPAGSEPCVHAGRRAGRVEPASLESGKHLPSEQTGGGCVAGGVWAGRGVSNTASKRRAQSLRVCPAGASDVERAVSRAHITHPYQEDVDQSPDAQASEAEELAQTFLPLAQIKPVGPEASKRDAAQKEEAEVSESQSRQLLLGQRQLTSAPALWTTCSRPSSCNTNV